VHFTIFDFFTCLGSSRWLLGFTVTFIFSAWFCFLSHLLALVMMHLFSLQLVSWTSKSHDPSPRRKATLKNSYLLLEMIVSTPHGLRTIPKGVYQSQVQESIEFGFSEGKT
jgi:hypothetical protein